MNAAPTVRPGAVELSSDPRFRRRVIRLTAVSAVALGVLWGLAVTTLDPSGAVTGALLAGWVLMPLTLAASLSRPHLRYGLVLPASLVSVGLLALALGPLPDQPAAAGWILMLAGVTLGGLLGLWFWYRLVPVPAALDDPFSPSRWGLVAIHVGLVALGAALAATALG